MKYLQLKTVIKWLYLLQMITWFTDQKTTWISLQQVKITIGTKLLYCLLTTTTTFRTFLCLLLTTSNLAVKKYVRYILRALLNFFLYSSKLKETKNNNLIYLHHMQWERTYSHLVPTAYSAYNSTGIYLQFKVRFVSH